jgi:fibronectin-binding autotransporter adhesin
MVLGSGTSSVVEVNGSTINGGTLTTASGGTVQNSGTAALNGVTISSGSTFTGVNGSVTTAEGTVTDRGTLLLDSTGAFTDLSLSGAVTLTGGGALTMSNQFANRIYGTSAGAALTVAAGSTIEGRGRSASTTRASPLP